MSCPATQSLHVVHYAITIMKKVGTHAFILEHNWLAVGWNRSLEVGKTADRTEPNQAEPNRSVDFFSVRCQSVQDFLCVRWSASAPVSNHVTPDTSCFCKEKRDLILLGINVTVPSNDMLNTDRHWEMPSRVFCSQSQLCELMGSLLLSLLVWITLHSDNLATSCIASSMMNLILDVRRLTISATALQSTSNTAGCWHHSAAILVPSFSAIASSSSTSLACRTKHQEESRTVLEALSDHDAKTPLARDGVEGLLFVMYPGEIWRRSRWPCRS